MEERAIRQRPAVYKPAIANGVMDLGTHEQYSWSFYKNCTPDHANRLDRTFRFVTEHGDKTIFPEEGLYEQVRDRV